MTRTVPSAVAALLLGAAPGLAADPFAGRWVNADEKAAGLTRLEVGKADKGWAVRAWGVGEGGEIDRGKVTLHLLGDAASDAEVKYGLASWSDKSNETRLTLRPEKGDLVAEEFTVFKGDSGRPNYRTVYRLKRDTPPTAMDDATRKKADQKTAKVGEPLKLADAKKSRR